MQDKHKLKKMHSKIIPCVTVSIKSCKNIHNINIQHVHCMAGSAWI